MWWRISPDFESTNRLAARRLRATGTDTNMRRHRCVPFAAVLLWSLSAGSLGSGLAQEEESPLISGVDLLDGLKNPERWLTYSGDYTGQRHSPLKQITPANVSRLSSQWTFQAEGMPVARGFE